MRESQTHDHQPCERCGDTSTCGLERESREPDLNRLRAAVRDLGYRVAQ